MKLDPITTPIWSIFAITMGIATAQDLYRGVDTEIKIVPSFRIGIEHDDSDDDIPAYSPYGAPKEQSPAEGEIPSLETDQPSAGGQVIKAPIESLPTAEVSTTPSAPEPQRKKEVIPPPPIPDFSYAEATAQTIPSLDDIVRPEPQLAPGPPSAPIVAAVPVAVVPTQPAPVAPVPPMVVPPAHYPDSVAIARPITRPVAMARPAMARPAAAQIPAQPAMMPRAVAPHPGTTVGSPSNSLSLVRQQANVVARQGFKYAFGRSHPAYGGLDSSGAVQFLLHESGVDGVPRTTAGQASWLRVNNMLVEFNQRPTVEELNASLAPGSLVFWGDIFSRRLTHVMIYLGYDVRRQKHLVYGTRGGNEIGINGHEVDIFTLQLDRERIIATGAVPGLIY